LPYEVLTNFDETDTGGYLDVTAKTCEFDLLPQNAESYLSDDYGASYFDDFDIEFEAEVTATSVVGAQVGICGISDTAGTINDFALQTDGIRVDIRRYGTNTMWVHLKCHNTDNTDTYEFSGTTMPLRYFKMTRSGTTTTLYIYSDSNRTSLVDTLSITSETGAKRYLNAVCSHEQGQSNRTITGYAQNFEIITAS
jgi:hypothetical protein